MVAQAVLTAAILRLAASAPLAVEVVAITMVGLPTLVDGLGDQAAVEVLKEAPLVVAVRALPDKAIAEDQALIVQGQAVVAAQEPRATVVVWLAARAARVVHLPLPAQRLRAGAVAAVAPTAQAVRAAAAWVAITPTMPAQAQRAQSILVEAAAGAARRAMDQTAVQALLLSVTLGPNA